MNASDVVGFDNARCLLTKEENTHDQPFIIFLTSEDKDARRKEQLLNSVFLDERVGIAGQKFCMIKASGEQIDSDHPFFRHMPGESLPRVGVFAADGTRIGLFEESASPSDMFDFMKLAFARSYDGNLTEMMKSYSKLLTSMATLKEKKKQLDDKYLTCETRAKEKALEKKLAVLEKQVEQLRQRKERILDSLKRSST